MSEQDRVILSLLERFDTLLGLMSAKVESPFKVKFASLNEWMQEWYNLYKKGNFKESSDYSYHCLINKYVKRSIGFLPLDQLTPYILQNFLTEIKAKRQREKLFVHLKDCFNKSVLIGILDRNPMLAVSLPKRIRKQSKAMNHDEEQRFVSSCLTMPTGIMFIIMLYTGIRKGEAMALTYPDLVNKSGTIKIDKSINDLNHLDTPKTAQSVRKVPILHPLDKYLEQIKPQREWDSRLFPITDSCVHSRFVKILKNANLYKQGFTIHSLRHTFATRCAEHGFSMKLAQKWLGHSTINMTMNVYTHINNDYERSQIEQYNTKMTKP